MADVTTPQQPSSREDREGGAVASIVAVLAAGGVLLGALAISVDVGRVMLERRELQNAADAGALAAAQACARNQDDCSESELRDGVDEIVNLNALDFEAAGTDPESEAVGGHEVLRICGPLMGDPCPTEGSLTDLTECLPLPEGISSNYIEVHTRTRSTERDSSVISNPFGGAIGGEFGAAAGACARAALGKPGSTGTTLPLAVRDCNWAQATREGGFAPSPPYSIPHWPTGLPDEVEGHVTHIVAHAQGITSDNTCESGGVLSMYAPGAFGWLADSDGKQDCRTTFTAEGDLIGSPGGVPPIGCRQQSMENWLGKEVLVPVFTNVVEENGVAIYTVAGVSSFFVAGYTNLTGGIGSDSVYTQPTKLPGSPVDDMCKAHQKDDSEDLHDVDCVWGWFTSPLIPAGSISSNPGLLDRGPRVIQLAG